MPPSSVMPRRGSARVALPSPDILRPMLAIPGQLPPDADHWAFEFKWDGVRALSWCKNGQLELRGRNGTDITARYPELHGLADVVGGSAVLDGEIVALDETGAPNFGLLQHRMHVSDPATALRLSRTIDVWYVLFDVLHLDGRDLSALPYVDRRELLENQVAVGPSWRVTPAEVGSGQVMLDVASANRLEGIVAKRLTSDYQPGRRSADWLKIKLISREEFVVGGWLPEKGNVRRIGALLVGYFDASGKLRYAGAVGSGLAIADQREIQALLATHAVDKSPFADGAPRKGARFIKPQLVAEIEYRRWPAGGLLQQPAFKGFRTDKAATEVMRDA